MSKVKAKQRDKITKDMRLDEVIRLYPESAEIMLEYGLYCASCPAMVFDTMEDAMKIHGLQEKDMEEMIKRINKIVKE